jgi:hypothetical protein
MVLAQWLIDREGSRSALAGSTIYSLLEVQKRDPAPGVRESPVERSPVWQVLAELLAKAA